MRWLISLRSSRRHFAEPNWQVVEAANGRLALDRIQESRPDVVVLDLMMPEMDGFELMATLQANADWQHIPVFVVTALDLTEQDRRRLNVSHTQSLQRDPTAWLRWEDSNCRVAELAPKCRRFARTLPLDQILLGVGRGGRQSGVPGSASPAPGSPIGDKAR